VVLDHAYLRGTDLSGAHLTGADLRGANLTLADLDGTDLDGVAHDETTTWPEGFDPPPSAESNDT
jgi:uncharacterized protein YjbI with pentapeptide repeats